ncbi:MAG: VTT domain-containing protein [candidate division WWE3 bacterium]|nr:VTT domain-containing protein [candidate division WWE3 bacterium]
MHFDLVSLIQSFGYVGIIGIVFAESGLLFGFFLPGDSLLITAGLLAARGHLNIYLLIILSSVAAIVGDSVGYWFGRRVGHRIFNRKEGLFFHEKNIQKAEEFYKKHGGKAIILARFMPFIRTFAPIVAGIGKMDYPRFLAFNVIGGLFWVLLTSLFGYFIGNLIPNIDRYILVVIAVIVGLSVLPSAVHFYKENKVLINGKLRKLLLSFRA